MPIMINKKMTNKKAVSFAIFLLVLSSIVLTSIALTYFYLKDNDIEKRIRVSSEIDKAYLKEQLINFYLKNIFDKASQEFNGDKQIIINNLKRELESYKDKKNDYPIEELQAIEEQLTLDNINISDNRLILSLNVVITNDAYGMFINYSYNKKFEKVFK